jgi:hypothetical protein
MREWINVINMVLNNGAYALNLSDADTRNVLVILVECKGA